MKKKRKPGPPRTTGKAPPRTIRVHDKEWQSWKDRAAKIGVTVSELIRRAMRRG